MSLFNFYLEKIHSIELEDNEKYFKGADFYPLRSELFHSDPNIKSHANELTRLNMQFKRSKKGVWAVNNISRRMVQLVNDDAILIPIPSSSGSTERNKKLCDEIIKLKKEQNPSSTIHVADLLTIAPSKLGSSSSKLRKQGKRAKTADEIGIILKSTNLTDDELNRAILIDNTISTGETALSAWNALGKKIQVITFLKARPEKFPVLRQTLQRQLEIESR